MSLGGRTACCLECGLPAAIIWAPAGLGESPDCLREVVMRAGRPFPASSETSTSFCLETSGFGDFSAASSSCPCETRLNSTGGLLPDETVELDELVIPRQHRDVARQLTFCCMTYGLRSSALIAFQVVARSFVMSVELASGDSALRCSRRAPQKICA